ncbi:HET-domain-containing protein [Nemania sp. FL0916]|nr:HET-domain-containing protein [Nemania sp. FL0916]
MLSRHSITQPLYRSETHGALPAGETSCALCVRDVFSVEFYNTLLAAAKNNEASISWRYCRIASDVYESVLEGCPWCASIGNAILMSANWDSMIHDENGSYGSTDSDGESDDYPDQPEPQLNDTNIEEQGNDSVESPGSLTLKELDCPISLDITIEITKWGDSSAFNMIEVVINVSGGTEDDGTLSAVIDDEPVRIKFEIISPDISPIIFPGAWGFVSAASRDWVTQAQRWLESCRGHKSCESGRSFQPTRLIDVRNPQHIKLVTAEDAASSCPYATLSYVWGPEQSYTLTKATYSQMHVKMDSFRIAKSINDGITVARRLGFEYLWVDALCIIQDSTEDKFQELPRMADIYRESQLTIVVASASSASDGFLQAPQPPTFFVEPFQVKIKADEEHLATLIFAYRETYRSDTDPINSRAWTLQERVLSKRLLIFSNSGVMWMCKELHINPSGPPDAGPPYQTWLNLDADGEDADGESLREQWMSIRADYSEMDISYCSDKLPAISALAAEISRKTKWTYVAGLWKENLFSELHWRSSRYTPAGETLLLKPQKVRDAGYIAPSWSWVSTGVGMIVDSEDERDNREAFEFEILDCQVQVVDKSDFRYGPVSGGCLVVRGKVAELPFRFEEWQESGAADISLLDIRGDEPENPQIIGDGTLDPLDDVFPADLKLICLGMSRLRLGARRIVSVEGLLLLQNSPDGTFRRVGFFRIYDPAVFDSIHARIMWII